MTSSSDHHDPIRCARELNTRVTAVSNRELNSLCHAQAAAFVADSTEALRRVTADLLLALQERRGRSLIRVGDGEGSALAVATGNGGHAMRGSFQAKFVEQNGSPLDCADIDDFCRSLQDAVLAADILGFRISDPESSDRNLVEAFLMRGDSRIALGVLGARGFLQEQLQSGTFRHKLLVSKLIYAPLLSALPTLMKASHSVVVVTGRGCLRPHFQQRLGKRLAAFIEVPVQHKFRLDTSAMQAPEHDSHYRNHYRRVLASLQKDLSGSLVLVGAGLFGKMYCHAAQLNGGVAVDLGSGFDLLAGLSTRPAHAAFEIAALRWTTS